MVCLLFTFAGAFVYPVSFRNAFTEFLRNRFGISDPGDDPFSLQSGHSLSSDSSSAVRTHSSQKELPQHGIITASVNRSLQMAQIRSSGITCFSSGIACGNWMIGLFSGSLSRSMKDRGMPEVRFTTSIASLGSGPSGQFLIQWPGLWQR